MFPSCHQNVWKGRYFFLFKYSTSCFHEDKHRITVLRTPQRNLSSRSSKRSFFSLLGTRVPHSASFTSDSSSSGEQGPYFHTIPPSYHGISPSPANMRNSLRQPASFSTPPSSSSVGSTDGRPSIPSSFSPEEEKMMVAYFEQLHLHSLGTQSYGRQLDHTLNSLLQKVGKIQEVPWWRYPVTINEISSGPIYSDPKSCSSDSVPVTLKSSFSPSGPSVAPTLTDIGYPTWKDKISWWWQRAVWISTHANHDRERKRKTVIFSRLFPSRNSTRSSSTFSRVPAASPHTDDVRSQYSYFSSFRDVKQAYDTKADDNTSSLHPLLVWWWWVRQYFLVPVVLGVVFLLEVQIPTARANSLHYDLHHRAFTMGVITPPNH